jgi:Uncharacterized conserved protein
LKPEKGIYLLILALTELKEIPVGKLGKFNFNKGYYIYVGSAAGTGGISGRLKHHFHKAVRSHWHIDFLSKETCLLDAYYLVLPKEFEHVLASKLKNIFHSPIPKFGSSDCKCTSHLFYSIKKPSLVYLKKNIHPDLLIFPLKIFGAFYRQ